MLGLDRGEGNAVEVFSPLFVCLIFLKLFSSVTFAFLGTGTMGDILKQVGTVDRDREILITSVNTPASWSAHALRTWLAMPSGPAALRGLTCLNILLMSA